MDLSKDQTIINMEDCESPGHYEVELLGNGLESVESALKWDECGKNPGHANFIPTNKFSLDHLPAQCRNNTVFRLVELAAELAVRIRVPRLGQLQGPATGTGFVVSVLPGFGPSPSCSSSKWNRVHVMTAAHVVSDLKQAQRAKVDLYFDDEESMNDGRMKTIKGINLVYSDPDQDCAILECELDNSEIVTKLKGDLEELTRVTYTYDLSTLEMDHESKQTAVIVSHPHGQPKMVTLGKLIKHDVIPSPLYMNGRTPFLNGNIEYDVDTCPGSSGACVMWLGLSPSRASGGLVTNLIKSLYTPKVLSTQELADQSSWEFALTQRVVSLEETSFFESFYRILYISFILLMLDMILQYGSFWTLWPQFYFLPEKLEIVVKFSVLLSTHFMVPYFIGYCITGWAYKICMPCTDWYLVFLQRYMLKISHGAVSGGIFWLAFILILDLVVKAFDFDYIPEESNEIPSLLRFEAADITMIAFVQGTNDRLCSIQKDEKGPLAFQTKHLGLQFYKLLYLFRFSMLYFALIRFFYISFIFPQQFNVVRNTYMVFLILFWRRCTWFTHLRAYFLHRRIVSRRCTWFTHLRAYFLHRRICVLQFVHSQGYNEEGGRFNKSRVGLWTAIELMG